jgi:hypothetical protein
MGWEMSLFNSGAEYCLRFGNGSTRKAGKSQVQKLGSVRLLLVPSRHF